MFEDINQHRAAVAEQIQKACEIGFTGNELEKAHKVGDIHPNGKWVWTQLPSGKYDWRVIKKTAAPSGGSAPKQAQEKKNLSTQKYLQFVNILKQSPNERHLEQMEDDELNRFRDFAHSCSLDSKNLNNLTRERCQVWRDLAKQEIESRNKQKAEDFEKFADQFEKQYRKDHPGTATSNSDIREQALKEYNKMKSGGKNKTSAFVEKTMWELKKTVGYRHYTDEKLASIAKKIQENEELVRKIMGGKFPVAAMGAFHPNEEKVEFGNDTLIFSAYKKLHSSRYAAHDGQTDYIYIIKIKYGGNIDAKEIARGSYSSGRYGGTAAEAKKECKFDALLRLIHE